MATFDVVRTPLAGRLVIEASAGTGKTWSLTRIVLRLVVQEGIPIERMLLVSFTTEATAELSTRVKELLMQARRVVCGEQDAGDLRVFFEAWRDAGIGAEVIEQRLRQALEHFDDALICTIHSFCQRMLKDCVFSQGGDLELDMGDTEAVVDETVDEFLRDALAHAATDEVRSRILKGEWRSVLKGLATLSRRARPSVGYLEDVLPKPKNPAATAETQREMRRLLESFVQEAPERLRRLKHRAKIQGFDDLLTRMDEALANPIFAEAVRARFEAVLIDEFQDTDNLQYGIFKTLFMKKPEHPHTLVFVGDPKQSIYSFRSSDIAVYESAVQDVGRTLQLSDNWRSHPTLVQAVNLFFEDAPDRHPFLTSRITAPAVTGRSGKSPLDRDGKPVNVFELWVPESGDYCPNTAESDQLEAQYVAEDIVRLLDGRTRLEGRALKPSDIAILTPTRAAADAVVQELARREMRVLRRGSKDDVFSHDAPRDMMTVLRAVESPRDRGLLAGAQATRLFGRSLRTIRDGMAERIEDSLLLKRLAERFERGGAAALFAELAAARRLSERLLPAVGGLRYLSDYRQMTEILHDRGRTHSTLSGLIQRFEVERRQPLSDESDRKLRLESDEDLINVQTLHASKGLEYPVVYLVGMARAVAVDKKAVFHVHNQSEDTWYVGLEETSAEQVRDCSARRLQEAVRLLYVGMTRASHRLVVPLFLMGGKTAWNRCANSVVMALWGYEGIRKRTEATAHAAESVEAFEERLRQAQLPLCEVRRINRTDAVLLTKAVSGGRVWTLSAAKAKRFEATSRLSSFTSIMRRRVQTQALASSEKSLADHADDVDESPGEAPEAAAEAAPAFDPRALRGPEVGTFLHEVMERADFCSDEGHRELVRTLCARHASLLPEADREEAMLSWRRYVEDMLEAVLSAPLTDQLTLRRIPRRRRVSEWPFTLSAGAQGEPRTAALAKWLSQFDVRYHLGELDDVTLKGYLTGTADLIFEDGGKFYLVDWKSNVLGSGRPQDYTEAAMDAEMRRHGYRLQYLIYLTALTRFLAHRFGESLQAAYQRIGGVFYVFLRGAGAGGDTQGVVRDRPEETMILQLNEFFTNGLPSTTVVNQKETAA